MGKDIKKISVVLPAYNEKDNLENAVIKIRNFLEKLKIPYEIIIVEDGSTDGTDKIAEALSKRYLNVIYIHSKKRLGKGKAISRGFSRASGSILLFMDCDLSTDLTHIEDIIREIESGSDIVVGSRLLSNSNVRRSLKREILSRIYNFLVRLILRSKIRDHQCGFKAFKREIILDLLNYVEDNHLFWDTEILVIAQRKKYKIKEIPVRWYEGKTTKVKFRDSFIMFIKILQLRFRLFFDKL